MSNKYARAEREKNNIFADVIAASDYNFLFSCYRFARQRLYASSYAAVCFCHISNHASRRRHYSLEQERVWSICQRDN